MVQWTRTSVGSSGPIGPMNPMDPMGPMYPMGSIGPMDSIDVMGPMDPIYTVDLLGLMRKYVTRSNGHDGPNGPDDLYDLDGPNDLLMDPNFCSFELLGKFVK